MQTLKALQISAANVKSPLLSDMSIGNLLSADSHRRRTVIDTALWTLPPALSYDCAENPCSQVSEKTIRRRIQQGRVNAEQINGRGYAQPDQDNVQATDPPNDQSSVQPPEPNTTR